MEIIEITKDEDGEGIFVTFENDFKGIEDRGTFSYSFFGDDKGITTCDYDEADNEDIYVEINNWIEEHIETKAVIKVDGKILN